MTFGRFSLPRNALRPLRRAIDLLLILIAYVLALLIGVPDGSAGAGFSVPFVLVTFAVVSSVFPVYPPYWKQDVFAEIRPVLLSLSLATLCLDAVLWTSVAPRTSAFALPVVWPLIAAALLCLWRMLERPILGGVRLRMRWRRPVAVLGATPSAYRLCEQIRQRPWLPVRVLGVYDDRGPVRRAVMPPGFEHRGGSLSLLEACRAGSVEAVYIALPLGAGERISRLREQLSTTSAAVFVIADLLPTYDPLGARWTAIGDLPLASIHDTPIRGLRALLKRFEDVCAGILASLLLLVPMAVIAVLVKASSPGPVFFRQRRYGLNGEEIRVLKFRTMSVCEDGDSIRQAQRNDARVTRIGRFLRRTSLDELPQFFQVVTGCMSLVGPRPHAVAHNERYRALIPGYMLRHKVKPGITGWAQVNGWRGETPTVAWMEKRVEHDLQYINNWSVLLDLKIMILTIFGRATRRNAF
jgi:putative colanic acid biosynthesis UDP-glucose lipid carrier transferase